MSNRDELRLSWLRWLFNCQWFDANQLIMSHRSAHVSLLAEILTGSSSCFQKCDRNWGHRFHSIIYLYCWPEILTRLLYTLNPPLVGSWWSQWGSHGSWSLPFMSQVMLSGFVEWHSYNYTVLMVQEWSQMELRTDCLNWTCSRTIMVIDF
jgi:hypothetical protein